MQVISPEGRSDAALIRSSSHRSEHVCKAHNLFPEIHAWPARESRAGARRAKEVGITVLLLVLFCSSSALADDFSLGTAGPGNWGILETGANPVSLAGNTGITANSGATSSQANLGINSGGKLNQSGAVVVQGTYYKFSTNSGNSIYYFGIHGRGRNKHNLG
jgi:hypothetical protein